VTEAVARSGAALARGQETLVNIWIKRGLSLALTCLVGALTLPAQARVVRQDEGQIASDCRVSAYQWNDDSSAPKAIVVIVHGFTQEGKSAEVLATQLAENHYLVLSLDQRGHGRWMHDDWSNRSGGKRRRSGRKVDYGDSENDLLRVCRVSKEMYPDIPLFCIGESAGSALVVHAAADERSDLIQGMVLSSPGTLPRFGNWNWMLHDLFANIFRLERPVDLTRYIANFASDDPRVCQEMLNDPLDRNSPSGFEILHTAWYVTRTRAAIKHLSDQMPLLVVQGSEDHILQPDTVPPLVDQVKSKNKQLVVFPQFGHVLVGTSFIRPTVALTITKWLESQMPKASLTVSARVAQPEQASSDETSSSVLPDSSSAPEPSSSNKEDRSS
jgi:alpha-beta hydrolase superfamily lysophospholipase